MTRPPTVPCEPIDAAAILDIKESCSSVVKSLLNCGISVIGEFRSAEGVTGWFDVCKEHNELIFEKYLLKSTNLH